MTTYSEMTTPIGTLLLVADEGRLVRIGWHGAAADARWQRDDEALARVRDELAAYFEGQLTRFTVPLAPRGSDFELRVWRGLREIPYGETMTYAELARAVGVPHGARAVGQANGRNPIPIIVPCHRVVAAGGKLGGFGGGLPTKRTLLAIEQRPGAELRLS